MKNRIFYTILLLILVLSFVVPFVSCQAPAPGEKTTLKFVSFLPNRYPSNAAFTMFIDKVHKKSNGALEIVVAGGPETMAPPDAPRAVQSGAIPIANTLTSLTNIIVPGLICLTYDELPYDQMRKNAGDYIQEICHKANIHFLGQGKPSLPQTMLNNFTIKQVNKIDDFKGIKLGTPSASSIPFYEALGCTPVVLQFSDYYTGLERGVIGGINYSIEDVVASGLHEVLRCCIDHPYSSSPDIFIINLDVWNSLSPNLQKALTEAAIETENDFPKFYDKEIRNPAREEMKKAGMTFTKFTPDEAAQYHQMYVDAVWGEAMEQYPEVVGKLRPLITK
jgi:TRAP-type C4-dicarboxylate transport system substrate-binding protein